MKSAHHCQSEVGKPAARPQKLIQSLQLVFTLRAEENCECEDFLQSKVAHVVGKVLHAQERAIHRQDPHKKLHRVHVQFFNPPYHEEEQSVDHCTEEYEEAPQVVVIHFVSKLDVLNARVQKCANLIDFLLATLLCLPLGKLRQD